MKAGQRWMHCSDGNVLPVKDVADAGNAAAVVYLGSETLTIVLSATALRRDWVCVDHPDNVTDLAARRGT